MKIKELAQSVDICTIDDNLKKAAEIMKRRDVDAVPILNEADKVIGVITQTGVCEAAASFDRKTALIKNSELFLEEILICEQDEKFDKVLKKLTKKRIKYAVFYSQSDKAIAIISLPKILLRFTEDKKTMKRVFRAMEKINKPLPLILSEINLATEER